MAVNRDKVLREAEKLVQKGRVDAAIREYEKLLKANPNDANTINRVGDLYGRIGEIDKAVELYERIAGHFQQDGFIPKAIAILKKINRLVPQRLDIFEQLADLYLQQGLVVEAINQYKVLADWYLRSDDLAKAIDAHSKLVQLDPSNHMAHLKLADLLLQQGEGGRAIGVYDKLGRMLLDRGKLDEAERLYSHVLEQDPPDAELVLPLVEALLEGGRLEAARSVLGRAREISPESEKLRVMEVRSLLGSGGAEQAMAAAEGILREQPDNVQVRLMVGSSLLAKGESSKARELMLPAIERLLGEGDFAQSQKMLQELLKAVPGDERLLKLALRAFQPSGNDEMVFTLRAALADQYFRSRQSDLARRLYMELLGADPQNKLFRQRLAQLDGVEVSQVQAPEPEPAAGARHEAPTPVPRVEPAPPTPAAAPFDPDERLAEATVFAKYGLTDKAILHLRDILRFFPDNAEAGEKLVQLLVEKGQAEEAAEAARPLVERLRDRGDDAAAARVGAALPGLDEAPAEVGAEAEEGVILIDMEDDLGGFEVDERPEWSNVGGEIDFGDDLPAEADESRSVAASELDFEIEGLDEGQAPSPSPFDDDAEELDPKLVIDLDDLTRAAPSPSAPAVPRGSAADAELDALEKALRGRAAGEVLQHPSAARPRPPEPRQDTIQEEMVEIGDGFAGPSTLDLQQLDFFVGQELYEDAVRLLDRLEGEYPGDPEVADRRLVLKAKGLLLEEVSGIHEAPEALFAEEEEYIDLARELEQELAAEEAMVEEATGRGKDEALLEEVFREFQKGVAEQLSEEDSDTHFNLGIAYKEMGLVPEAIREFQIASRDGRYFVECCSMIGVCYLEQGIPGSAAEWFERALAAPEVSADARLALRYELASALEMAGELAPAHDLLHEISSERPGFRDVDERIAALSQQRRAN